jgi:transcription termination factor Rho
MSVLDRSELEQSHLADLHAIASELGIEGYRRLSRDALIEAILAGDGGGTDAGGEDDAGGDEEAESEKPAEKPRGRGRRLRLRRGREDEEEEEKASDEKDEPLGHSDGDDGAEVVLDERDDSESSADEPKAEEKQEDTRTGVLDILPGGSGFMRENPFVHAREDVYVSPAQIRRCELRSGDELSGPVRPPRRSERYPSLVRVESVNGQPADEIADRPHFDDLTPTFATEALETIHGLPFGKGSRVAIGGPPGAGATRLLREVTETLEGNLDVLVVLSGVRPEEVTEWKRVEKLTVAGGGFDRPPDELAQIADMAIERAKRIAERGGDAVVIVDGLDVLAPPAARRVFGAARNTEEAGSLTVVAATGGADELLRLATTRVVLTADAAIDPAASGTLRGDLLGG